MKIKIAFLFLFMFALVFGCSDASKSGDKKPEYRGGTCRTWDEKNVYHKDHKWSKWEIVGTAELMFGGAVVIQSRQCEYCGKTEMGRINP